MFSFMQDALHSHCKGRIALRKGVHDALHDFRWIARDVSSRPTRIQELVPLSPSLWGYHDAAKSGVGGVLFPAPHLATRIGRTPRPILWRYAWPPDIQAALVSHQNPAGSITSADLELAGAFLQLDAAAQCFDVRERTIMSNTDNLPTLFWTRKGSTTSS